MDFEYFRKDIELKLSTLTKFELQEYHFEPINFGSGILVYRIKGRIHKFVFDGKENELIWLIGNSHRKEKEADWTELKIGNKLEISIEELDKNINQE